MTRSTTKVFVQPNEFSCGPASLKIALNTLNVRVSYARLFKLTKTTKSGANAVGIIRAANALGLSAMTVANATLRHIQSPLRRRPGRECAVIVDYLYLDDDLTPEETGHFAAVAGFSARTSKIILFDSYSGTKKSYLWTDFLDRWYGYEPKRIMAKKSLRRLSFYKRWQNRHMIIIAKNPDHLPKFKTAKVKHFPAKNNFCPI